MGIDARLEALIETQREGLPEGPEGDPGREALTWLRGLEEVDPDVVLGRMAQTPEVAWLLAEIAVARWGREAATALLTHLENPNENVIFAAIDALTRAASPRALGPLAHLAAHHPKLATRTHAAYGLATMWPRRWTLGHRNALEDHLLALADDPDGWPPARAQAFEGVAYQCQGDRRRRRFQHRVTPVVLRGLADPDPEVRFWACFAAWQLKVGAARPLLEALRDDHTVIPGLWSVSLEATDALEAMAHRRYCAPDHAMRAVGTLHRWAPAVARFDFDRARHAEQAAGFLGWHLPGASMSPAPLPERRGLELRRALAFEVTLPPDLAPADALARLDALGFQPWPEAPPSPPRRAAWIGPLGDRAALYLTLSP